MSIRSRVSVKNGREVNLLAEATHREYVFWSGGLGIQGSGK